MGDLSIKRTQQRVILGSTVTKESSTMSRCTHFLQVEHVIKDSFLMAPSVNNDAASMIRHKRRAVEGDGQVIGQGVFLADTVGGNDGDHVSGCMALHTSLPLRTGVDSGGVWFTSDGGWVKQ